MKFSAYLEVLTVASKALSQVQPPYGLMELWMLGKIVPILQRRKLRLRNEGF